MQAFHNMWELAGPAGAVGSTARDGHLFSLFLMLPLASTTLGLLLFNWYPSEVSGLCPLCEATCMIAKSCLGSPLMLLFHLHSLGWDSGRTRAVFIGGSVHLEAKPDTVEV
jgi:hypothetical protein